MQFDITTSQSHLAGNAARHEGFFVTMSSSAGGPAIGSFLTYYVHLDEPGEFYADVRDAYGKTVFEIDGVVFKPGIMDHGRDLDGLKGHLIQIGLMTSGQDLVMG